jgi:hypothetical protein
MVTYCDTSDSESEFDNDGYKQSKTKSFKKKANATNSNSNEFELGPEADTSDSNEFELGPKADTVLSKIESEDEKMIGLKRKKLTANSYTTGVVELADKEKRAMNKKIMEEALPKIHQF